MIKAVILDWGGVIAPNPEGGWLNVLADKLGISVQECLPYWIDAGYLNLSKGLIDEAEFWDKFESSYGRLSIDKNEIWLRGSALSPWPEMMTYIDELKSSGLKVAVLSNTLKPMSRLAYKAKLYDVFDLVVLSDEVGLVKPDREIYERMAKKLNVNASECIYVDDLPKNLVPAHELGMRTVLGTNDPKGTIAGIESLLDS